MTRIKVVSVLAVAFVLTAFGATGAFAWQSTISAAADCHFVVVTGHDKPGDTSDQTFRKNPSGTLIFAQLKNGHIVSVSEDYTFDASNSSNDQEIAKVKASKLGPGEWVVVLKVDSSVKAKFTVPTNCTTPTPTATATPHPTATATATPKPTETASPAPTETASPAPTETAQPTSSALPSPPVTGQGPGGSGSGTFVVALLVMVVGTIVIGGTTLVLSRKGS